MPRPRRAPSARPALPRKLRLADGRLITSLSRTGDPACSQAVSDWKIRGMTPELARVLAVCREHAARRGARGPDADGARTGAPGPAKLPSAPLARTAPRAYTHLSPTAKRVAVHIASSKATAEARTSAPLTPLPRASASPPTAAPRPAPRTAAAPAAATAAPRQIAVPDLDSPGRRELFRKIHQAADARAARGAQTLPLRPRLDPDTGAKPVPTPYPLTPPFTEPLQDMLGELHQRADRLRRLMRDAGAEGQPLTPEAAEAWRRLDELIESARDAARALPSSRSNFPASWYVANPEAKTPASPSTPAHTPASPPAPIRPVTPGANEPPNEIPNVHVATDLHHIPADRIRDMLRDGLVRKVGRYVYFADVTPDGGIHVLLLAPRVRRTLHHSEGSDEITRYLPANEPVPDDAEYDVVYQDKFKPDGGVPLDRVLERTRSLDIARRYSELAESQTDQQIHERGAIALNFALHMTPGGAAAHFAWQGNGPEAVLSLTGDLAFLLAGPLAKLAAGANFLRAARLARVAGTGIELGLGSYRAGQGFQALVDGRQFDAAGHFGEATLRLLGVSVSAISALRRRAAHAAAQAAEAEAAAGQAVKATAAPQNPVRSRPLEEAARGSNIGVHAPGRSPADFAGEAAAIQENAARSRGLVPNPNVVAAKAPQDVDLSRLIYPESRPFADPQKLLDHGPFDWQKYEPIWVETDGRRLWLMNGVTRVENAKRAKITKLPAYIFRRQ